ncbi:MAG: hypothetical protein MI723_12030 [Caulobacterales bacterium]|nr:hypothetical protein [Caulobacterales bacterium]
MTMMRVTAGLIAAAMLATTADAQWRRQEGPGRERGLGGRLAISGGVGTNGLGAEVQARATDQLVIRGGGYYLGVSIDESYDDVDYDADIDFTTGGVFADFHPFSNGWLISGGGYFGARELGGSATPSEPVDIGDFTFQPEEIGTLLLDADLGDSAPFVGVGFNNAFSSQGRISYQAMLGVMFTGAPEISLESVGGLADLDPVLRAEVDAQLALEEANIEDDLDPFRYYPVLSLGLNYRF